MIRSLSLVLVAALTLGASPAFAGTAETAFMGKLVGTYAGKGTLTGSRTGTFECTLTMRAKGEGISYRGKCDVEEFGSQSFSGDITYNDKAGRYEASSPTGTTTVGSKSGGGIAFTSKFRGMASGTSVMKMASGKITVDTTIKDPEAKGGTIQSHIVMSK
jgi:hypothetical protein